MARGPVRLNQYDQRTRPQSTDQPFVRPVDNGAGQLAEGIARIGQALRNEAQVQINREEDDGRVYASSAMARARAGAGEITRRAFQEAQDGWRGATQRISTEWGALREEALSAAPTPAAQRFLLQAFDAYQPELLERAAGAEQEARQTWRSDELDRSRQTESNAIAIDPSLYGQAVAQRAELIGGLGDMDDALRRRHIDADRAAFATTAVAALINHDPAAALQSLRGGLAAGTPDSIASAIGGAITSAERTPERNAEVGGAPNSMHLSAEAVDLTVPERYAGMDRAAIEADVRQRLDQAGIGASEIIYEGDHIHIGWRGAEGETEAAAADTTGPYGALTGPQRLQFINQAEAELDRRRRASASAVEQRMRSALALLEVGEQPTANAPTVEEVRAVSGEAAAAAYQTQMETFRAGSEMGRMTNQQLLDLAASPQLASGTEQERYQNAVRRRAAAAILELRNEDPVDYQLRQGLLQRSDLIQAFNGGDMGLVNGILQNRSAGVMHNSQSLGVDHRVLTLAEANVLGTAVRQMTAQERGQFMRNAAAWMGQDAPTYRTMMAQLFPDSPATAYAGFLMGVGGEQGASDAQLILRGEDLLGGRGGDGAGGASGPPRSRLIAMPSDDDLRRVWRDYVGDAYSGIGPNNDRAEGMREGEAQAFEAYRAAYAGLIERSPQQSDAVNERLAQRAAQIASGGVVVWNGRETLLPPGMDADRFSVAVRDGFSRYQQFQNDNPRRYTLAPIEFSEDGRGLRYGVYDGADPVRSPSGRPVEIEVRRR